LRLSISKEYLAMRTILFAALVAGALALALASTLTARGPAVEAAPAKNLKIYPKGTDTAQIKKDMKVMAKALGQECDYCHDLDAMDKDSPMKEKARLMMKMVGSVNDKLKKDGFKDQVTCNTCHAGAKKPKK
jgi:Photosynthetic reaction centre cytochrome C subunit